MPFFYWIKEATKDMPVNEFLVAAIIGVVVGIIVGLIILHYINKEEK